MEKIVNELLTKVYNVKRQGFKPSHIVVSEDVYFELLDGARYPGSPRLIPACETRDPKNGDSLLGVPIGVVPNMTGHFIEVGYKHG